VPVIGNNHCFSHVNWSCIRLLQVYGEKSVSARIKDEDKIRRAAEEVDRRVRENYPQVKTEIDFETIEAGEDAYVWITVDTPDSIDDVPSAACNYAGDFWEAEDIFIVPRLQ
jgi:hypothetical protein